LAVGFERSVGSTEEYGASVDWLATTFSTIEEAITYTQKHSAAVNTKDVSLPLAPSANQAETTGASYHKFDGSTQAPADVTLVIGKTIDLLPVPGDIDPLKQRKWTSASGLWDWKVTEFQGALGGSSPHMASGGTLSIAELESGITGASIIEASVNGGLRQVMALPLNGTIDRDADGQATLSFKITSPEGVNTETVAKMNKAGDELSGVSVMKRGLNTSGHPLELTYRWTAVRKTIPVDRKESRIASRRSAGLPKVFSIEQKGRRSWEPATLI
jgi:hypothetical protein